jgi:hypothetical protein
VLEEIRGMGTCFGVPGRLDNSLNKERRGEQAKLLSAFAREPDRFTNAPTTSPPAQNARPSPLRTTTFAVDDFSQVFVQSASETWTCFPVCGWMDCLTVMIGFMASIISRLSALRAFGRLSSSDRNPCLVVGTTNCSSNRPGF